MKAIEQTKLYGLKNDIRNLINIYDNGKLPNKILISGIKGIGKSILAYHFINYILSIEDNHKYNVDLCEIHNKNKSFNLLKNKTNPNFYEIIKLNDKKNIEISQIRNLNNFINKSSFNNKLKLVLIDDLEFLSNAASNALLKIIEEPNNNVQFILVFDNSKFLLDTIRSRCIEFKVHLKKEFIKTIVDNYFDRDVYDYIPKDFKNKYYTPRDYINLIKFCEINKIELENINIKQLIEFILKNKIYKNKSLHINEFKLYFETYLLNVDLISKDNFFLEKVFLLNKKFSDLKKFNLDMESFFLECSTILKHEK